MQLWKYRHFKWGLYEVIWIAKHSETLEDFVVYRALYTSPEFWTNALWIRPKAMFEETIIREGKEIKRFEYIWV